MTRERMLELLVMLMIGKGVVILLNPRWHLRLWRVESPVCRKLVDEFSRRPTMTRSLGALAAVLGIALALRQEPD